MTSWKVTLPCTRAEAEAIDAADDIAKGMVLMTTELEEDDREHWRLDAYLEVAPTPAAIAAIRLLAPSAGETAPQVEELPDEDWVTLSQDGLEPIAEGRFVVHTSAHPVAAPAGGRAFLIEAGQAFGTGHHATTSGCLAMLDRLADQSFARIIDIGTGTGLLAFAAQHLWPTAEIVATDIDPRAIIVTRENAELNALDGIALIVADGALDDTITARAPYDLVIANILAGPLVSMAPELAAIAAPGATIVLAGLLDTQRVDVVAAFAGCGCTLAETDRRGDWTILRLVAGAVRYVPTKPIDPKGRDGWALDL
ncbi:50S ribosomal protein L11 methyltransferase [Sphingomonas sp. 10B4]|uniref:50S ribosomal protein L11 methyltransferase n=1 Tax=Sphingomonas sp. 10B4 TaxID=3048575 RepID=UPI002AB553E5|nr:50S ribosomal protein L11 methyltransferase [Sphingomonas sp. 10B4]MDY7524845.1 50S ribosomal protein L11 methyltransferase [Sphingomonas sp. 10B4]MEB0284519.1 50S ribosomal protein L11 methyltransferase [Sphingomonas sp. 10B4]